ncbi:Flp family type IVb pilin [Youngiibacter fragilis]|uniref:Flp/Fap pilin protein n=1 Tax=Youngiibacter fragilis 232.1 TaxID=994573 RepID=V7I7Z3_9CLOT|nr:Flp family type IVb pilin [Youngiibacter fragilis]ETA81401.1 Flp/Fap pilin protein [Youngiibacter fragilis 232.1]
MELFKRLWNDEEGQGMVEYGLIIALVSIAVIGLLIALGGQLGTIFTNITNGLKGTPPPSAG